MIPEDPRHGTYAGAAVHRTDGEELCPPCKQAWLDYGLVYKKERALGYARRVPATHGGAWDRIDALHKSGESYRAIGAALNLREGHAYKIHVGIIKSVTPETWRKIMARSVTVPREPTHIGTVRRVRALAVRGWPGTYIQREAGLAKKTLVRLIRDELQTTEYATRYAIAEVYERLWDQAPPPDKHTVRAQRRALREHWAPPAAWDDIDYDPYPRGVRPTSASRPRDEVDPVRVDRLLSLERVADATKAEKVEAMRRWLAGGRSERSLCQIHGWHDGRYTSAREDGAA